MKSPKRGPGRPAGRLTAGRPSTRDRLLAAAQTLFARHGYHGATMQMLGVRIGISKPSILYHFPSKRRLYGAVLDGIVARLASEMRPPAANAADPLDDVNAVVDQLLRWARKNPEDLTVILRDLLDRQEDRDGAAPLAFAAITRKLRKPFERARAAGILRGWDPDILLFQFIGTIVYFHVAAPTIARLVRASARSHLDARFSSSVHRVLAACVHHEGAASYLDEHGNTAGSGRAANKAR